MTKEKIADKVEKLLALSKSSNEHEAALVLENANKLLMKYNMEMADITDYDVNNIIKKSVMTAGRIMQWKTIMMQSVMELNNCDILIHSIRGGDKTIFAIGKKQNIDVSLSMYDYLEKTMKRKMRKERPYDKPSFRLGFAITIAHRIKDIIEERSTKKDEFNEACTALVVQEKAEVPL